MPASETEAETGSKRDRALIKRRRQIIEAAVMCFIENGYHQTGVRDIAGRAGVSLGNLYNHFAGKHDILAEIAALERAEVEPFLKLLAKPGPAARRLDRFVRDYAKYMAAPENVILSIEITSEALRKPDIAKMFLETRAELVAALEALIRRGEAEGALRPQPAALQTAQLIIELIEGSAHRSVLGEVPLRKVLRHLREFVARAVLNPDV